MKRIVGAVCLLLAASATLLAVRAPNTRSIPNFDKRHADHPPLAVLSPEKQPAADRLQQMLPGAQLSVDRILHSPNHIASPHEFLSGPNGTGKAISDAAARSIPAADPHHPIKAFLAEHAALFGHGPEVLNAARISRDYTTAHNGLRTTIWQQRLDDIDVFEATLMGHVTAKGELVNISSTLIPDLQKAADAGVPRRKAKQQQPPISARQALSLAASALEEDVLPEAFIPVDDQPTGADKGQRFHARPKLNECRVQLVWLPMSSSQMRLCWFVRVVSQGRGEAFHLLIDADSGELLVRRAVTVYLTNATYNVFTSDSPSPFSPGLQSPGSFQAPIIPRTLVTTVALDTNASPIGWISDPDNETKGNNVDAHLDRNRDDQPDLPRPQGNPRRVFDFPLDLTQDPTTYGNAAVVSLFYWCNWMHDQLYNLGFTEAAGNSQDNNFNRGGLGNDAMQADSQDGSGFNNANLTPNFDGFPCRIQMYIFDGPTPNRDGDLDTEVMLHEYTHSLSERLVGGGVLISELQTGGMGEGWSDFYALSLLSEAGDDVDAAYPMGGYITFGLAGMTENYYYGIRRYPYCTDMSRNPLTFKDIDPSQALAHFGVPLSPIFSPFSPVNADEVHNQGEVWCVTLWEARANLIKKWGYAIGNKLILQLVTDGMKLGPANPNFLQARDAIIQADQVNNNGANYNELWAAFAKRGMGGSAGSPSSSTTAGVVEAFDVPGLALKQATIRDSLTGNGNGIIDVDECLELFVTLRNNGRRAANNIAATLTTTTPGVSISQGDSAYPLVAVGATVTNLTPFRLFVTTNFFCGTIIDLALTIRSDQDTRTIKFRLPSGSIGSPLRYDSDTPVPIPDADLRGVDSPISVSGFDGALSKVTVSFYATHTWDGDLTFQLIAPDGTKVLLSSHNGFFGQNYGGGCTPDSSRTTFDDNASISILSGSAPFVGTYRPQQNLSTLNGKSGFGVNGTWSLHCVDDFFFDTGTLQCWSLKLFPSVCSDGGGECSSDLAVSASVKPNPPIVGSNLTYTVIATNRGPIAATGVYVTNTLPAGVQYLSSTSTRGTCTQANGLVTCAIGALVPNSGATITIAGHPTVIGYVTNTAVITAAIADSNRSNNTNILVSLIPAPTPVIVPIGSHLISEDVPPPNGGIDPDETVTIDFSVQNIGTGPASNLVATLLSTPGVSPLSGTESQVYGYVPLNAAPVARPFSFKATGTNGQIITPTLALKDGTNDLGTISFAFGLHASFVFANPNVISVSDSTAGAASVYPSTIFVSGVPGVIGRVNVTLNNLSHSFADDLDILLVAPDGRTVLLMSDAGGGNPLNNVTLSFDDVAPALPDSSRIVSGSYRPTDYDGGDGDPFVPPAPAAPYGSTLASLNGISADGLWSLFMFDDTPGDGGRMAGGWTLTIETIDPVDATADLVVSGTVDPPSLVAGSDVVYNLSVLNQGPDSANNVVLTSQLPPGAIFVSGESGFGACSNSGSIVTCYVGALSTQEEGAATVVATLTRSGTTTNIVTASADEVEPNPSNNSTGIVTTVSPAADVAISINAGPAPAVANQNLPLSVVVTNIGPNSASALVITNRLPPGIPVSSIVPSQGSNTISGNVVRWTINNLAGGAAATLNVVLRPVVGGSITTTADVKSSLPVDLDLSNNSASLSLSVSDGPVIIRPAGTVLLSEAIPSGGIDPNEQVTVSFALRNIGISNATSLVATLRQAGGVSPVTTSAAYGSVLANGPAVARSFTFTNTAAIGDTITAIFDLTDSGNSIGSVSFPFVVGGVHQFSNPNPVTIRDNGIANPYPSTITVSGASGLVSRATVTLSNVSHTFPSDIDVLLVAPNGRSVLLMSDVGGINGIANVDLTFDQSSSALLPENGQIVAGTYRPTDFPPVDHFPGPAPQGSYTADLSPLAGIDPNGTWSLFVVDDAVSDEGTMGGWSLNLTTVGAVNSPQVINLANINVNNGQCRFTINGHPGDKLVIQVSSDLENWTAVSTNVLGAASMIFTDIPVAPDQRFYRVLRQP